jgi:hypothetical protein
VLPNWSVPQYPNRMAHNALKKRLSRLENAYGVQEDPQQRMLTKAARLTREERRARIAELESRLLVANGLEPTPENRFHAMSQFMLKRGERLTLTFPVAGAS